MSAVKDLFSLPLMKTVLGRSPLVYVDVGAAVGVEEPWLTMVGNPQLTRVVAFEPMPENFRQIARLPNGDYHQVAVGERSGTAEFFLESTMSSLVDRSRQIGRPLESIPVQVRRLDDLREDGTIPSLDVLKTDTECTDYESIESAGRYLDDEVLAVQAEFAVHGVEGERPFRDYDALLQPKGFLLVGLSTHRGPMGEIAGGNFLYVRSAFDLIRRGGPKLQERLVKLFAIAVSISHLDMAYCIARAAAEYGAMPEADAEVLRDFSLSWVYVPDTLPFTARRVNLATMLGNLTAVVAGGFWRGVSTPEANRLENYRRLVRKPSRFTPAARAASLYEVYFQESAKAFAQTRVSHGLGSPT